MLYASGMWAWHMLLPLPLYCCQIQFNCQQQYEVRKAVVGEREQKKAKCPAQKLGQTHTQTHIHRATLLHTHTQTHSATLACGHKHKQALVLGLGLDRFTHNLRNFRPPARPQHTHTHAHHSHTHTCYIMCHHFVVSIYAGHTRTHCRTICRPFVDICTLTAHPQLRPAPPFTTAYPPPSPPCHAQPLLRLVGLTFDFL